MGRIFKYVLASSAFLSAVAAGGGGGGGNGGNAVPLLAVPFSHAEIRAADMRTANEHIARHGLTARNEALYGEGLYHEPQALNGTDTINEVGLRAKRDLPTSLPSGWSYGGCYDAGIDLLGGNIDNWGSFGNYYVQGYDFGAPSYAYFGITNKASTCIQYCDTNAVYNPLMKDSIPYQYAGTTGGYCFCGQALQAPAVPNGLENDGLCNNFCDGHVLFGNPETCGGAAVALTLGTGLLQLSLGVISVYKRDTPFPFPQKPATLPTDWAYVGCYDDPNLLKKEKRQLFSGHTLGSDYNYDEGQTAETCITYCSTNGRNYQFAGTENGNDCFCSNSIQDGDARFLQIDPPEGTQPECPAPCGGANTEACGGVHRISIYQNTAFVPTPETPDLPGTPGTSGTPSVPDDNTLTPGWHYLGCYNENAAERTLREYSPRGYTLSNSQMFDGGDFGGNGGLFCTAQCGLAGYSYAGTQSHYCYCSDILQGTASTSTGPNNGCDQSCGTLNPSEACGAVGPDDSPIGFISIYTTHGDGDLFQYPQVPAPENVRPGWVYRGCVDDPVGNNALVDAYAASDDLTNNACIDFCIGGNFQYAGTGNGNGCICGNTLHATTLYPDTPDDGSVPQCVAPCSGSQVGSSVILEVCGGNERLTLFERATKVRLAFPLGSTFARDDSGSCSAKFGSWAP